jgi:hypothetical protein
MSKFDPKLLQFRVLGKQVEKILEKALGKPIDIYNTGTEIVDIGYVHVADGVWSNFPHTNPLDENEIIIQSDKLYIEYSFPLKKSFIFIHKTDNKKGFTRKELAEQIMDKYINMYEEEEKITNIKPGTLGKNDKNDGKYGIWGYTLDKLILHSIKKKEDGVYTVGIDG